MHLLIFKPQVLPRVAAEVSAPLAQTDKITMVSTGDGPVGAQKLTEEVCPKTHFYKMLNFGPKKLQVLPRQLDQHSHISSGDPGQPADLLKMILQMLSIMGSLPTMVKDMTGVDIKQKITASA